jgi:2-polyprenyl-3-methyl-5-hydroxy-6-metoxy-1,4-benzoquinol methylase
MKTPHCPQCRSQSEHYFRTKDHNRRVSDDTFDYYRCHSCGFIFLSPVPGNLERYYPTAYYEIPRSLADLEARAENSQLSKLDVVTRFARGGRLLEIGPAYGLFAYLAKRAGFEVSAIEMDARCCEFLRNTVGIEVVEGANTSQLLQSLPQFDVIVLWQVLEHLVDAWQVLAAAANHLAPGGHLIVDTPNPDALQFKVFGPRWTHVDAPRHVCLIEASLLVRFAKQHRLESVELDADGTIARGYNSFGWAYSLNSYFAGEITGRMARMAGRILNKSLIPIERTGWRGSTYTAVFRKVSTQ